MRALIVAPIHQPVVGFRLRLEEPLVGDATGKGLGDRLAEIASLLHPQIRDDIR